MEMRIRENIFPRRWGDRFCFLLIALFLPPIALFDLILVVPAIHMPGGFMHTLIFALGVFLFTNILGNMLATMMVDTSIDAIDLDEATPRNARAQGWYTCRHCIKLVPPRSYHCKACRTCILKRDHHCVFTGCCIGHYNFRYFALFLFYMFIGSVLSFGYLTYYMFWVNGNIFLHFLSFYKMLCPILMTIDGSVWDNVPLIFYNLNTIAVIISSILLFFHGIPILNGSTSYERRFDYPYGRDIYSNLRSIFGIRMYLVWLSPFISSDLLEDGANWNVDFDDIPLERLSRQANRRQRILRRTRRTISE
ncbi:probable palmitoyltransferase ZDHHC24 [Zeugodacus cucurbitae]|uniref:probable palmitoyltransferase ZDHHC24 n=1 Tax=Zeugodacus cucurbitae TaxID=28588 RepID=UPI000596A518|nr:probable palmitoyltransferase ZDHHC24 [Zeugodacus cucurbitae]